MRFPLLNAVLLCAGTIIAPAALAQDAPVAAPSFSDLESRYPHDTLLAKDQVAAQMELARTTIRASVPIGTPIAVAEARLQTAGAACRADRRGTGVVKCLYHQYDLGDGAADDIRWTVTFRVASDQVSDMAVNRYVDRHGTS